MTGNPRPARVVSPGAILKRELAVRGWTQQDLVDITGRPAQTISEIVRGSKRITPETALQLGEAFGTSAELWLDLDARYQLRRVREQEAAIEEAERIRRRSRLYSIAPVLELLKRNWIRDGDTLEQLEEEVCGFLGIHSLEEEPRSFRELSAVAGPGPGGCRPAGLGQARRNRCTDPVAHAARGWGRLGA